MVPFMISGACRRSEFSTTTRQIKNGKVKYVNHYMPGLSKSTVKKTPKSGFREPEVQKALFAEAMPGEQEDNAAKLINSNPAPVSGHEHLIASNTTEPAAFTIAENRFTRDNPLGLMHRNIKDAEPLTFHPDTLKSKVPKETPSKVRFAKIKLKNGKEETGKIIYQSGDTLSYKPVAEQGITRTVSMNQVEKILPDTRKTEKLGLAGFILSILGLIPILGIPFAIMAFIFGVRSLRKIKKNPEKYKGKGLAMASKIIGAVEILCYILLAIGTIIYGLVAFILSLSRCTGG
jgi:Domain of unknown function (DUF4190)